MPQLCEVSMMIIQEKKNRHLESRSHKNPKLNPHKYYDKDCVFRPQINQQSRQIVKKFGDFETR